MPPKASLSPVWPVWMSEQQRTLLEQAVDQPSNSAWVGISSTAGWHGKPELGMYRRDGQIVAFPGESESEVFVWQPTNASWAPELWISPRRRDYRAVYSRFLSIYWPGADLNEVRNHVDHVFPKKPAVQGGLSHVRLLAIPTRSNVSAGTLEKLMVRRNRLLGRRRKRTRLATLYALSKATGYVGYTGLNLLKGRRAIAAGILASLREGGVSPEISESGFDEELLVTTLADLR